MPPETYERPLPCRACGSHEFYSRTNRCAPCQRVRVGGTGEGRRASLPEGVMNVPHRIEMARADAFVTRVKEALAARYGEDAPDALKGTPTAMPDGRVSLVFRAHLADCAALVPPVVDPLSLDGVSVHPSTRMREVDLPQLQALAEGLLRVRFGLPAETQVGPCAWKRKKAPAYHVTGTIMAEFAAADEDAQALWDWSTTSWTSTEPVRPARDVVYDGPMATPGPTVLR